MQPLIVEIEPDETPEPENYEAEVAVLRKIIDLCEAGEVVAALKIAEIEKTTAWIAFQLATLAGSVAPSDIRQAYALAALSLKIAYQAGKPAQIYNSLLNWAGVLLRDKNFEEAESVCFDIIDSLLPGGTQAKAFVHMTLGGIYNGRGTPVGDDILRRKAIYHYERGLRYLRGKIEPDVNEQILYQLVPLYRQTNDLAGAAYVASHLTDNDAKSILKKRIEAGMSLEEVVSLVTRLNSLAEYELADVAFRNWQKHSIQK